jgi:hypothetical protein
MILVVIVFEENISIGMIRYDHAILLLGIMHAGSFKLVYLHTIYTASSQHCLAALCHIYPIFTTHLVTWLKN